MSDPVFDVPREIELTESRGRSSFSLLRRRDFRTLFIAVSISELGDALNYIALMWVALEKGGPLGVVAVRIADSVPRSSSASTAGSPPTAGAAAS